MFGRLVAGTAAGAASLALAPAALAAPVLQPLKPCYVSVELDVTTGRTITEQVVVAGSGFTPNARVDVQVDGNTVASGVLVDPAGNLPSGTVDAPYHDRGQRPFTVTVVEQGNPAQTVSAQALVTALGVAVSPRKARPSRRITLRGRGFTADAPVWAHYVRKGKSRKTVRLARRPNGPCGTFRARRRQFPFRPKTGRWTLQIDQQRRYSREPASAFVQLDIFVRRVVRLNRR